MPKSRSSFSSSNKSSFKTTSVKSKPITLTKKTDIKKDVVKPVQTTQPVTKTTPITTKTVTYHKSSGYYDSNHHYQSYNDNFFTNLLLYDMITGNHQTVVVNGAVQPVPYQSKGFFGILWDVTSFLLTGAILFAVGVVLWKKFKKEK